MTTRGSFYSTSKAKPNIGRLLGAMEKAGGKFTACLITQGNDDITINPDTRLIGSAMVLASSRGEEELHLEVRRPHGQDLEDYGDLGVSGIPPASDLRVVVRMEGTTRAADLLDYLRPALQEVFKSGVMEIGGKAFLMD